MYKNMYDHYNDPLHLTHKYVLCALIQPQKACIICLISVDIIYSKYDCDCGISSSYSFTFYDPKVYVTIVAYQSYCIELRERAKYI